MRQIFKKIEPFSFQPILHLHWVQRWTKTRPIGVSAMSIDKFNSEGNYTQPLRSLDQLSKEEKGFGIHAIV
jgi:ribonuclease HIII